MCIFDAVMVKNLCMSNVNQILKVQNNIEMVSKFERLKEIDKTRPVVFLCVGNSKIWYDCFGPYMGSLMQTLGFEYFVYGNNRANILLDNIEEYISMIYSFHINPFIVVLDSAISNQEEFDIRVEFESTVCGALSETPVEVGDFKISCLVPAKQIKSSAGYVKMLKEIKRVCFFLNFVFNDDIE